MPVLVQNGAGIKNGQPVSLDGGGNPVTYTGWTESIPNASGSQVSVTTDGRFFHMDDGNFGDLPASSGDYASGTNADAVITLAAAGPGRNHVLTGLAFGYNDAPTNGYLKVEDGAGVTVFRFPITSAGAGFVPFDPPKRGSANTAMIITLGGGGLGVTGEVSVIGRRVE